MRWKQILESSASARVQLVEKAGFQMKFISADGDPTAILRECSRFAKIAKATGKLLYRGLNQNNNNSGVAGNSTHADSGENTWYPRVYEVAVNEWFKSEGFAATRTSVYASADPETAKEYGEVYIVVPSNDFRVTWCPEVDDMHFAPAVWPEASYEGDVSCKKFYIPPLLDSGWVERMGTIDLNIKIAPACYGMKAPQFKEVYDSHDWFREPDIEKHIAAGLTDQVKWERTKKSIIANASSLQWVDGQLDKAMVTAFGNEVMLVAGTFYMIPVEAADRWLTAAKSGDWQHTDDAESDPSAVSADAWEQLSTKITAGFPNDVNLNGGSWKTIRTIRDIKTREIYYTWTAFNNSYMVTLRQSPKGPLTPKNVNSHSLESGWLVNFSCKLNEPKAFPSVSPSQAWHALAADIKLPVDFYDSKFKCNPFVNPKLVKAYDKEYAGKAALLAQNPEAAGQSRWPGNPFTANSGC